MYFSVNTSYKDYMDLLQLKYFQDAASTENFSKTAAKFTVPPSCVSLYIKKLEQELGVKLFDRSANRIKLNNNGKILLTAVNNAFLELEGAKNKLMSISDVTDGEISLLIETNRKIVMEYIAQFRNDFPQVTFHIEHKKTSRYNDYDIIISDQKIDTNLFDKKILVKEEFLLAVNSNHPLANNKSVDIAALKEERFVCMPKGSSMREVTEGICALHGFLPYVAIESDDPFYIREYIGMGMGISLVPEFSWAGQYPDNVVLLRLNGKSLIRETNVYTKKNGLKIAELFAERLGV